MIAKRLERLLNLRIVTAVTKIHEVMKNCIKITRGVTVVIDDVYNCLVFDNIFVFPNILYLLHYFCYKFYFMFILFMCVFFLN